MHKELGIVGIFASANLSIGAMADWLMRAEPIMHFMVTAAQLGVSIATILFIIKKLRSVKAEKADKDE